MENNWNQLIERYLNGELSAEGKEAFELELGKNQALQQEMELHQLTQNLIKRAAIRNMVVKRGKFHHLKKKIITTSIVVLVVAAAITAAILLTKSSTPNTEGDSGSSEQEVVDATLLETMEKELQFDNIDPQYFKFTGENDVFLSESGVLLSITENSFELNNEPYHGEAVIQWQEAQKGSEIVKAGLSTTSGKDLLETQGMFSLNVFTPEGKPLELSNTGIYVQVPVKELKDGMMLYQGVKDENGKVDWVNPAPMEKLPIPKSMAEIDLYPPKYEPKLNELKWFTDKAKRDSLYLSFDEKLDLIPDSVGTPSWGENHAVLAQDSSETNKVEPKVENPVFPVSINKLNWKSPLSDYPSDPKFRGELLFKNKCATCHSPHKDGTGPALFGVRSRWAEGGAKPESIYNSVVNQAFAASQDPYAEMVLNYRNAAMQEFPEFIGNSSDIDAIFDYIDSQPFPYEQSDMARPKSHIPPSKVLAIWNTKFDNTNLATVDFEKRMKIIHNTCDERVFDIYAKNLNTPLWQLDQQVVKLGYPEFQQFADERVGKLKLTDAHQQNLRVFYDEAIKTIRKKGKEAALAAIKKDRDWDQSLSNERTQEVYRKGLRESVNRQEEFQLNFGNVCRQLGYTKSFYLKRNNKVKRKAFSKPVPNIVNIDRLVREATANRQSTIFQDAKTGKTAKLTYSAFSLEVEDAGSYDKLYVYLFPKEINSYQRLDLTNGKLDYKLNGDMNYKAVVVGMNENGFFLNELDETALRLRSVTVSLEEVSESEFDKRINAMNSGRTTKTMEIQSELNWLFKEKANYKVQKQRRENAAFRALVRPTIYRCEDGMELIPEPADIQVMKSDWPEEEAKYPGGKEAMDQFLVNNLDYPKSALDDGISGTVYLKFKILENGKIDNVEIKKGIPDCQDCNIEAKRVVEKMPNWIPAKSNGKNVSSNFTLPILFSAR